MTSRSLRRFLILLTVMAVGPWLVGLVLGTATAMPLPSVPMAPSPEAAVRAESLVPQHWRVDAYVGSPMVVVDQFGRTAMLCSGFWQPTELGDDVTCTAEFFVVAAGWPCRSVVGAGASIGRGSGSDPACPEGLAGMSALVVFAGHELTRHPLESARVVPLWPLLPGYLMNSVIYALVTAAAWSVAVIARRGRHKRSVRLSPN